MGEKEAEESESKRWHCVKDLTGLDLLALKMEERATSQGQQVASKSWKGQGSRFSTEAPRKECNSADTLTLVLLAPFWTSDLQNYKITNLCYFKQLGL